MDSSSPLPVEPTRSVNKVISPSNQNMLLSQPSFTLAPQSNYNNNNNAFINQQKKSLQITIINAVNLPLSYSSSATGFKPPGIRCIVKLHGREVFRTELSNSPACESPTWNAKGLIPLQLVVSRSRENSRPFTFEHLELEFIDYARNNSGDKIGEAKILLTNIGTTNFYKVLKIASSSEDPADAVATGRVAVELDVVLDPNALISSNDVEAINELVESQKSCRRLQLCQVIPAHLPQYQHIYISFDDWTYGELIGMNIMPGPRSGEIVLDKHEVEWGTSVYQNAFGDRSTVICRGTLYITDIRILFIPAEVKGPYWIEDVLFSKSNKPNMDNLTYEQIVTIRRFTVQLPLSSIQEIRYTAENRNKTLLIFDTRDGSVIEFAVRSFQQAQPQSPSIRRTQSGNQMDQSATIERARMNSALYRSGLDSEDITPQVWCGRIYDEIMWRLREDSIWIQWMKYLIDTCERHFPASEKASLLEAKKGFDWDQEYRRLKLQDSNWRLSEANIGYQICPTYPKDLIVPAILKEQEVCEAALERSKGRIASLVWIHPKTKASLTRASQPMAGMSGTSTEADRKYCFALKAACPTGLALRIADARPRLNANANAFQGKGFENVSFLGGPKVASLVFLDIENIHVMRSSYNKLKEGVAASSISSSSSGSNSSISGLNNSSSSSYSAPESNADSIGSTKWLHHISLVLRGALSIAESLTLGHPVLIHCSDGWDRTAQLAAATQLILDPFYRTINGFFVLINKEFVAFGHRFEYRLNKSNHKETSPVFFQFLDAVFQLIQQFPKAFEFTEYFLTFLVKCAYSGYFTTFRCNCEKERNNFVRKNIMHEEKLQLGDSQYSTVYFYIGILLRSPGYARLLINPFYQSAVNLESKVKNHTFLRPSAFIHDMKLWREGILGYVPDAMYHYGNYHPTSSECQAIMTHGYDRFYNYYKLHSSYNDYMDEAFIHRSNVILKHDHFFDTYHGNIVPYHQSWNDNFLFRKQYSKMNITNTLNSKMSRKEIYASARLMIWYRSEKDLKQNFSKALDEFSRDANGIVVRVISHEMEVLLRQIFRAILQSEYRLKYKLRLIHEKMNCIMTKDLVLDIVEGIIVTHQATDVSAIKSNYAAMEESYNSLVLQYATKKPNKNDDLSNRTINAMGKMMSMIGNKF